MLRFTQIDFYIECQHTASSSYLTTGIIGRRFMAVPVSDSERINALVRHKFNSHCDCLASNSGDEFILLITLAMIACISFAM